jgi:hypothetical protein
MDALYIVIGIAGLAWIGFSSYMAYRNRKDDKKRKLWIALAGVGLIPIVLAILRPGAGKEPAVIEVKPHEREVAPDPTEQAELDADAKVLEDKTEDLRDQGEELDTKAEELDDEKAKLDEKADETDKRIAEVEDESGDDSDDPGPSGDRKPDSRIADRLRGGG